MSTSREDFEAWASTGPANLERTPDGAYVSSVVASTYRAWQARDAEVEALKAENAALRHELADAKSTIYRFHYAMKDAGWHPGRTDDNLCEILLAKGKELSALRQRAEAAERRLHDVVEEWAGAECGEPVTAQEAYAIALAKRMYRLAAIDAQRKEQQT